MTLRVLDLFSGIGGFSLGLERAGLQTVAFVEINPFCRRVLATHWPKVPCYHDIQAITAERLAADRIGVDVIVGGFPCQDISVAGAGVGLDGARSGLWWEYARLIYELRPRWAIIENVSALRSRGLDVVLSSLAALGYDAEWHIISAAAVGAPHLRERVWIIAHADGTRLAQRFSRNSDGAGPVCRASVERSDWWAVEPAVGRVAYGIPGRVDRLTALGNAVVPQIVEYLGRAVLAADAEFAEACHAA
jgi:DNA (cytosine-5)-methyltransferase 1